MNSLLSIQIIDHGAVAKLVGLQAALLNTRPAMLTIGEYVTEVCRQSFERQASPSGLSWAANSPVTILRWLEKTSGNWDTQGKLSKKGAERVQGKRILRQTGDLMRQFSYSADADSVTIRNTMPYARMMQFGGTVHEWPHLWGDIPARPFAPLDPYGHLTDEATEHATLAVQDWIDAILERSR